MFEYFRYSEGLAEFPSPLTGNAQFRFPARHITNSTQDNYLDAYLRVVKNTDPLRSALVFSCGMGAVRTTFAMVAALIVRRKMVLRRGLEDPYANKSFLSMVHSNANKAGNDTSGYNTVSGSYVGSYLGLLIIPCSQPTR